MKCVLTVATFIGPRTRLPTHHARKTAVYGIQAHPNLPLQGNVRYRGIHDERDVATIGLFELGPDAAIPLHDHPRMGVVSLVVEGRCSVLSFDTPGRRGDTTCVSHRTHEQGSTFITPPVGPNVHAFWSGSLEEQNKGCIILDVIVPPYAWERQVTYFAWKTSRGRRTRPAESLTGLERGGALWQSVAVGDTGMLMALDGEPSGWSPTTEPFSPSVDLR